jgi:LysR family glycine cleavage system transcriptional activator
MQRRLPPLNALRAFEAAARLGSFERAASELHVTHGAVSRHVQLLEDWLGVPMFRRLNRRVELTEPGKAYLAEIGAAFDRIALGACPCNGFLLDVESRVRFIVAHEQDFSSLGR